MILIRGNILQLGRSAIQRFLAAAAAVQQGRKRPAAADRSKDFIPGFGFSFQLDFDILKTSPGFFFFCIGHGNTMDGLHIHDAGFFRFFFRNVIFRSNGNGFTAGFHSAAPEGIRHLGKTELIRHEMNHGHDLGKDSTEGTADDCNDFPLFRRDSIPLHQTAEKAVARVRRQGTQGTGTIAIRLEGGNQIRQQPGARMQESRKRNRLIAKGLESDHARDRDGMQTGGRYVRRGEDTGKTACQHSVKNAERIIRTYHGRRQRKQPDGIRTGGNATIRFACQILGGKSTQGRRKQILCLINVGRRTDSQAEEGKDRRIDFEVFMQETEQGESHARRKRITKITEDSDAELFSEGNAGSQFVKQFMKRLKVI